MAPEKGFESDDVSVNEEQNGVSKEEGDGGDSEVTEARADVKASTDAAAAVEFAAEASLPVAREADVGDDDEDDEGKLPIPGRGTVDWTAEPEAVPFPPRTGAVRESGRRFSSSASFSAFRFSVATDGADDERCCGIIGPLLPALEGNGRIGGSGRIGG